MVLQARIKASKALKLCDYAINVDNIDKEWKKIIEEQNGYLDEKAKVVCPRSGSASLESGC